ncbi:hypothetical protein SAMN05421752_12221 [Natronorubrum thiooxidans]|uniref:Uncharacterized protein n=1 Tax=Natronorubrum thiooxidans TaxID=308853 RepID=A0A1N7H3I8_9EURY|nr:hypothetical protein SAMN05421752_12221 [Natronorubrum thiooxidans]
MRDRLEVDLVEGNEFVGKEVECPSRVSFWRFAAGEFDEVGFGVAIEFAFVLTVRFAAMNRRNPSFSVVFACVVDGLGMTVDVLTDCRISEPVVSFQKDSCACVVLGSPFTGRGELFERLAVFVAEFNNIFLPSHSVRDALREDTLDVHC